MSDKKVYSGLLEFNDDLKVMVAVDEDADVKKAVTIDEDGAETSFKGTTPTGKINITSTAEVNVASYATAQVVDADLVASNIKKDVDILGVVGSYEPQSDFTTAEVTFNYPANTESFEVNGIFITNSGMFPDNIIGSTVAHPTQQVFDYVMYKGLGALYFVGCEDATITGDAAYDEDEECILITGDCTITITANQE